MIPKATTYRVQYRRRRNKRWLNIEVPGHGLSVLLSAASRFVVKRRRVVGETYIYRVIQNRRGRR